MITGKPDDHESIMSGLAGGRRKRTSSSGTSLAAHPTRRPMESSGHLVSRRKRHSAASSSDGLGFVLVTHPFHPLSGWRLEVLFAKRRDEGVVFICAGGVYGSVTLPEAWTDRGVPAEEYRLSVRGLVELESLTRAIRGC
jgi:Family of unknown function (DUF5372)